MRIGRLAMDDADIAFLLEEGPGPKKRERQPANVFGITRPLLPTREDSFRVKYPEPHPKSMIALPGWGSRACMTFNGRCHWLRAASIVSSCERVLTAERPTLRRIRNPTAEVRSAR